MAGESRWDEIGELRYMTTKNGWVMARRRIGVPFCIQRNVWDEMSRRPLSREEK